MECTIYLTEACNLRCSYCYEGDDKRNKTMSSQTLYQAIDFIVQNNPQDDDINITFLGGEPLLNKKLIYEFINIIDHKHSKIKHKFKYAITTNGILLDSGLIKLFKENSFDVSISIDGDRETHNLNRVSKSGEDVYDDIVSNMQLLHNRNIDFSVRMTVSVNNVAKLYQNVCYFYDMGVKKINVGIDNMGYWSNESLQELDQQYSMLDELYLNSIVDRQGFILNLHDFKVTTFIADRIPTYCSGGSKGHLIINSSGELFPCGYVVNDQVWNVGSVDRCLDHKKFMSAVRENVLKKSVCHECDIAFTCSGAKCGFYNYMKTGKLNQHTGATCQLERLLYKHNYYVIKELYKKSHKRVCYYLEIAAKEGIKLSATMMQIINEVKLQG